MDDNKPLSNAEAFDLIKMALEQISGMEREDPVRGTFFHDATFYRNHQFVRFEISVRMPRELALKLREALLRAPVPAEAENERLKTAIWSVFCDSVRIEVPE